MGCVFDGGVFRRSSVAVLLASFVAACGGNSDEDSPGVGGHFTASGGSTTHAGNAGAGGGSGGLAASAGATAGASARASGGSSGVSIAIDQSPIDSGSWLCAQSEQARALFNASDLVGAPLVSRDGSVVVASFADSTSAQGALRSATTLSRFSSDAFAAEPLTTDATPSALALSDDGSVLLGSDAAGVFIWDHGTFSRLPFDSLMPQCAPILSADGRVSSGCASKQGLFIGPDGASQPIFPVPSGTNAAIPRALNGDGTRVLTLGYDASAYASNQIPFLWTPSAGAAPITLPSGLETPWPLDLSADGNVIALTAAVSNQLAPRWQVLVGTTSGELDELGDGTALKLSSDGSVAYGGSHNTRDAFRWERGVGRSALSIPASIGGVFGAVIHMSSDGRRALIRVDPLPADEIGFSEGGGVALWDQSRRDFIVSYSGLPADFDAFSPSAMSLDGRVLIGTADCGGESVLARVVLPD